MLGNMEKIVFDGEGAILGRMATVIAKELLKGNSVDIINSEEVVISGDKNKIIRKIQAKMNMGRGSSLKGPKYIRREDRLLKRMIRGMLPRNINKGREAFKRLKCYVGSKEIKEDKILNFRHRKPLKFSKMKEIVGGLK